MCVMCVCECLCVSVRHPHFQVASRHMKGSEMNTQNCMSAKMGCMMYAVVCMRWENVTIAEGCTHIHKLSLPF